LDIWTWRLEDQALASGPVPTPGDETAVGSEAVPETGQTAGSEAEKKFGVDAAINLFEKLGAISFEKIFDVVFVDVLIVVVVV
jgi:hypothetical protein